MPDYITAEMFSAMFISGAKSLESKKAYINELNVFPVPDGDTGTNMSLTLEGALKAVYGLPGGAGLAETGKAVSDGALKGARGNSGVIMSQLIRGFSDGMKGHDVLDKRAVCACCLKADELARKAVSNPKEGTMLTVARAAAQKAGELCGDENISMEDFLKEIVEFSDYTLSRTPEMLPVLKEAGVVDSGGQGLVEFYKGAYEAFTGKGEVYKPETVKIKPEAFPGHVSVDSSDIETSDIKYTYCTEFIVCLKKELKNNEKAGFKEYLEGLGDSLVFVCTDDMIKIHVHTNHPGLAFEKGLELGPLTAMKIDNMKEEHARKLETEGENRLPLKEYGFVSVCCGEGIKEVFRGLSVDMVVEGGQTMNPSSEDIAQAVKNVRAQSVFVLPNNSNVILAANQAKELCKEINVQVIPTKSITEGISAVINYQPSLSIEENAAHMEESLKDIKTAQITYAVRDSETEGVKIKKGDYMAFADGCGVLCDADLMACFLCALKAITDEDSEIISIYYGKDVSAALAQQAAEAARQACPEADIELIDGGQPVYEFIISAE